MQRASAQVVSVVEPVVTGLGYELVGAEFGQTENGQTLRIYIDSPKGIVLDDCATVSRQLDAVLDVEDAISSAYSLEVSSPGVDRPLFTEAQFAVQAGQEVKIRLLAPLSGRRHFKGRLQAVSNGVVTVMIDGQEHQLAIADIEQANVIGQV